MNDLGGGPVELGEVAAAADLAPTRDALIRVLIAVERNNVNDILTVLSELETNALHHAGGATGVRALLLDDMLRLEVDDASARSPAMRPADGANGGFGLRIVDQLTVRWGYTTSGDGKTVWAILPCPSVTQS